jgi:hypothetical protein
MVKAVDERYANGSIVQQINHAANKARTQKRNVAGRQIGGLDATTEGRQSRGQTLHRPSASFLIADDNDVRRQWRHVLTRGRNHDDGSHDLAQQADDPLKHRLPPKRQPSLGPTHPLALPSAKNDAADFLRF